jgi:NCAIR mutase (PurE)-related protein
MWATGQSSGAPDRSCSLSSVPSGAFSDSARVVALFTVHYRLLQTTVGAVSRCSAGTSDSPVLHLTVR